MSQKARTCHVALDYSTVVPRESLSPSLSTVLRFRSSPSTSDSPRSIPNPRSDMEYHGWSFEENYNLSTNRRSIRPQDELVELLWRDGQVVLQSQTHREQTQAQKQDHHQEALRSNTFLEDQETVSWIQYPPDEDPFETDDLSSHFFSTINPLQRPTSEMVKPKARPDPPQVMVKPSAGPDPPQVMPPPKFRLTESSSGIRELGKEQYSVMTVGPSHCGSNQSQNDLNNSMSHDRNKNIEERLPNASSSSGGSSGCSFGKNNKEMASERSITTDRKRKHIMDTDESVSQSDAIGNKSNQPSGPTRRSRAAEVHNLSERRRRDRINERMKALQELIPHCSKTDKASILDEAIDYLKSLQLQLQVMWIGSGMAAAPLMFPGVQPPQFIRQMQGPVQLPRFPVMDRSVIQIHPGLVCQPNPVQNQVFSEGFARYIGGFPQMQAESQPMEMLRFGSPAGQQSQLPPSPTKTTEGPRLNH